MVVSIITLKRSIAISAILAALLGCGASQVACGGTIAIYTFTGPDPGGDAAVPVVTGATLSALSRVNLSANNVNDQFTSNDFAGLSTIDTGEYIEFTVTADAGYKLDLESISFKHTRGDQNTTSRRGPQSGAIRASFESFGPGSGAGSTFSPSTTQTTSTWDFADYSMLAGGSVTFRFYGWNQTGAPGHNSQRLSFDDVALFGIVTYVAPTVNDEVRTDVIAGEVVTHNFTANEPDGDAITWSNFIFGSYTPAYGGAGAGPGLAATFNPTTREFSWNSLGSPRGIYEWFVTATDKDASDAGSIVVHVMEVPEPASLWMLALAMLGVLKSRRLQS